MNDISIKDAVSFAAQVAQVVLSYQAQGYIDISIKQVNDPNEEGKLQEQVLLDMKKNGESVEVRLFSKHDNDKVEIKEKTGKINGK
jgi:predicted RNA-binding protein with RPS1 domain